MSLLSNRFNNFVNELDSNSDSESSEETSAQTTVVEQKKAYVIPILIGYRDFMLIFI